MVGKCMWTVLGIDLQMRMMSLTSMSDTLVHCRQDCELIPARWPMDSTFAVWPVASMRWPAHVVGVFYSCIVYLTALGHILYFYPKQMFKNIILNADITTELFR